MNKKGLAISQIVLLVVGLFAFAYAFSDIGFVSANGDSTFEYNDYTFTIISSTHITMGGYNYRYDSSHCTAATSTGSNWYYDINNDGAFGDEETDAAAVGTNICMLKAFVDAIDTASTPVNGDTGGETEGTTTDFGEKAGDWITGLNSVTSALTLPAQVTDAYAVFNDPTLWGEAGEAAGDGTEGDEDAEPDSDADTSDENGDGGGGLFSAITGPISNFLKGNWQTMALNLGIAVGIYFGISGLLPYIPGVSQETADAAAAWITGGFTFGSALITIFPSLGTLLGLSSTGAGVVVAIVVAVGFALFHKVDDQSLVVFTCYPWKPTDGGSDCDECGSDLFPCTEYQCRSLGRSCELLNEGEEKQICAYVDRNDVDAPTITARDDSLNEDYSYTPDNAVSPPDRGVNIVYANSDDGCAPAFARVGFGIELDKPARCKIDNLRKNDFSSMKLDMSNGWDLYNHSFEIPLPSPSSLEAEGIVLENGGNFELFVRCESRNGIPNGGNFVFKYCVNEEPDWVAPTIETVSPLNGMPVGNGVTSVDANIYVNKPSDCKWSHSNKDYENMENTMTCSQSVLEMEANSLYKCQTTLTGLNDNIENKFYFRCKSYPLMEEADRYTMGTSYEYSLFGTQPLVIDSVGPGGVISGASQNVKVTLEAKTSAGYNDGAATCEFGETSDNKADDKFTPFLTHEHSYNLWLAEGDYEYFIKCCDLGNNCDTKIVNFEVETDFDAPMVVRAYYEGGNLNLVTNEEATCFYDTRASTGCLFIIEDDGPTMTSSDNIIHSLTWNTNNNLYVKCRDEYGTPPTSGCSIVVRPFEFF